MSNAHTSILISLCCLFLSAWQPVVVGAEFNSQAKIEELTGRVVGITDGDTFTLLKHDSTTVKIRLASIDCPERKQAYSAKAKEFVSNAIFGKEVRVEIQSFDRYRRAIALVYYGRKCLNEELLKNGFAWHYKKYSKDARLQSMEDKARKLRRGLWADAHPVAPWNWRER
ncbi:thermonuclease family protein [Robiginitalea biformata]|uniref:thermonuclease family protein n=1 Tax=Robiginitalea biformata TaxID=252307 RepID=UPI0003223B0B|nr:thermonuclease family protein [Robiginitalea biformata]